MSKKIEPEKFNLTDFQVFFILGLVGLALYFRSLFFGFTYLDDNVLILDNLKFLQNWGNVGRAFTEEVFHILHSSASYYRPLLTLSFMWDAMFSGASPFFYHLTNVVLHLIASCLIYKLFTHLKYSKSLAFLFSLIFVVHPVLTQAVSWVPGRNDSLLAVFALAAFTYFIKWFEARNWKYLVGHILFFAAAMFTKESGLVIPVLCGFWWWVRGERRVSREMWGIFTGWGFVGLLWFLLRHVALKEPAALTAPDAMWSVVKNLPAVIQFIGKIFFPFNLSVLPIMQDTTFVWGGLAVIGLGVIGVSWVRRESWGRILFGLVWFLAFLLPSFIRPNPALAADFIEHRVYVPLIGLFIILAETSLLRNFDWRKPVYLYGSLGVLGVFGVINFVHQGNFSDRLVFWHNAAINSPHYPLAQRNLGAMYYLSGDLNSAETYYKKSLELNPTEQMVHNNLGLIYAAWGQNDKAEAEYKAELFLYPNYDNANFNLGLLYYKEGRVAEAKVLWEKTLQINPDYADAAKALEVTGR